MVNAKRVREATLPVLEELLAKLKEDAPVRVLVARLFNHARFLSTVVMKVGIGEKLPDHTECTFGRWYKGEGGRQFGHQPAWQAIDEPHRLFHAIGAALTREARSEKAGGLARDSLNLLRCSLTLKKEIAGVARAG